MRVAALIVAAGRGLRAGREVPKQYSRLAGIPLLRRTAQAILSHRDIGAVQVVFSREDQELYESSVGGLPRLLPPAIGGATRQQSVCYGLEALASYAPDMVLVHDAARPFVTTDLLDRVIKATDGDHGTVPAVPVSDALKRVGVDDILRTVPRDDLVSVQTPQGFPFAALLAAHRSAAAAGVVGLPDDVAVAVRNGLAVRAVPGDRRNFKLTEPADFTFAEELLARTMEVRTAQGFDVHAFGPGVSVRLCGVDIPHERSLLGHSDADVGLHALTDALLGTLGDGDIGAHFPPSELRWKGASSDRFLAFAAERVSDRGGRILSLDVTLVCEEPKIGPHREAMRAAIAAIAGIQVGRVSVKATTSEGLGFTGRREGIAALAVASIELPRQP